MYLNFEIARKELHTLSRGNVPGVPVAALITYVLDYCMRAGATPKVGTIHGDSGQFLRSLYALKDLRPYA
jgi:hypothetical protein